MVYSRDIACFDLVRGKYHPPNGQPDGEKPLYLHISAGSQVTILLSTEFHFPSFCCTYNNSSTLFSYLSEGSVLQDLFTVLIVQIDHFSGLSACINFWKSSLSLPSCSVFPSSFFPTMVMPIVLFFFCL